MESWFFHYVSSEGQTQVDRLVQQALYPLSHLASPEKRVLFVDCWCGFSCRALA